MATSRISSSRSSGSNTESQKRFTQFLSFANSVQEYNAGTVTNAVVQNIQDAFAGNNKYFTLRPSIEYFSTPNSGLGAVYGVSNNTQYSIFGSSTNIWVGNVNSLTTYIPAGAALTTYQSWVSGTTKEFPFLNVYQKTDTTSDIYGIAAKTGDPTVYECVLNFAGPTYTAHNLGFNVVAHGVALDGYMFFAKDGTDIIYNSALNDLATWNLSVNNIRASQRPGNIKALARLKAYVIALKDSSYEFFYDAGITDSSPLQRVSAYVGNVGVKIPDSITTYKDELYMIGSSITGNPQVMKLTEYGVDTISTQEIERVLQPLCKSYEDSGSIRWKSGALAINGKDYYFIEAIGTGGKIFCYDIEEKVWCYWDTPIGSYVMYKDYGDTNNNNIYWIDPSGYFYIFGSNTLDTKQDGTKVPIVAALSFPKTDFGDTNRKFMNEITFSGVIRQGDQIQVTMQAVTPRPATIVRIYDNPNNMNRRNYGMFNTCALSLQYTPEHTTTQSALDLQFRGFNMEITLGN